MHNFNVFHNDLQFKACNHAYRLQFTVGTTLREKEFADIPKFEYAFKKFSEILVGDFHADLLVDIIGVVDQMVFSQTQASLKKIIFNIRDSSGDVITCTLWESHAMKFFNCYNNFTVSELMIVLLTHARDKEGQGKYPSTVSNSWCGSKILIDDEIPDYQKYKDSFATLTLSCDSLSQGNNELSQYSNLSDDDRFFYKAEVKSFSEIAALTSAKEITCVTIGTTAMFIVGKQREYYGGCSKCTKKADLKDVSFTCKCGTYNLSSTPS
ncbi:PREDICTED: replication protein A 70 kDa DNA-binding subunit-like [Lupinus angustifolius]|uniref:replication protein A 70 kDa DNA-binding subunit-like n=1 Tax=Lupinus angustifolius TaxID=3871 RepID=UPI00092F9142|nr:PREDICTED: replication protein A 70 kDa DNA-binding subunit-like [Lupinus angustifolius]XP_019434064.1 PREDICTED: replication protein A 70 kDa DNA-binding subunit-like [Lupinus angustifolius]